MELPKLEQTSNDVFAKRSVEDIYREIQEIYLSDKRPWIVGYSGGKDSTTTLQLIFYALLGLDPARRTKEVHVISSDTLVETPVIVDHIVQTLRQIEDAARAQGLPIRTAKVQPELPDTFWVNLLGKGYPAPSRTFRWCTERMKIRPADRFIQEKVAGHGEVVVVLGVRKQESATRAQVVALHRISGSRLSRHSSLRNAYVYAPIEDFSLNDVWSYLLQVPSPWGANNRNLVTLYRNAQAGECPLVVDDKTSSCGNSRFGCWVCTVVTRDKAMEAMIDNGEEWMQPLLDFRDLLSKTQDPAMKAEVRDFRRRDGSVTFKEDGKVIRGPYTLEFCKTLLRKLLEAQKAISSHPVGARMELVTTEELHEIRRLWRTERRDWEDSVPRIVREVTGRDLNWVYDDRSPFSGDDAEALRKICEEHQVPDELVSKLLDAERDTDGMSRRHGIFLKIDHLLKSRWGAEAEIRKDVERTAKRRKELAE